MLSQIEIRLKSEYPDSMADSLVAGIHDLGINKAISVRAFKICYLNGNISKEEQRRIAEELLIDPVLQQYSISTEARNIHKEDVWSVEISFNRGVMDSVAESTLKAIADMGITSVSEVKTARRYEIESDLSDQEKTNIVEKLLANKVIEHVVTPGEQIFFEKVETPLQRIEVDLKKCDDSALEQVSKQRNLFLNLEEMRTIQAYFRKIGRNPTDVELETLAQTWSEHCSHKTLTGLVEFEGAIIDNLLKQTIFRVTSELNKPWCVSVFKDNSGIIRFDNEYNICFKVETHNHPSAMEPYGGANTGIGGVIRDPLGTGLGAKPIINTDVFCFGPVDMPHDQLPKGVMHPKRIMQGVVAGVRDYGNRMGIPTSNGAIFFDERYIGNPLVYCGNVGLIPVDKCNKTIVPGDYIVVIGGRTGRDGIHGATASSGELHTESEEVWSGAVQIGNPITEKKVVDTLMQARDLGLYRAITDCGAGGLSSAVGELAEKTGAIVDLEKVPLKYQGLTYMEIWISEAQERMVIFIPPDMLDKALELFASENVEATVIGRTTNDKRLRLRYQGELVADLDMQFLHKGLPRVTRRAVWRKSAFEEPNFADPDDLTPYLHRIISAPNVCSKEWVIRQYDHEVQGGSVLKPLIGVDNDGPGDACITRPRPESYRGVILSNGINPKYGVIDPYWMAASAIDEAVRNIIAVGGSLEQTALLDNFCWGNTDKPDRLGGLVRAAQACYDISKIYETPFISGKDSLNNEFSTEAGEAIAVPPTLLISAISVMLDVRRAVSMDFKKPEDLIYIIGETKSEMGGSHYYDVHGFTGNDVPQVEATTAKRIFEALASGTKAGLVRACHDCSEGGLAVAIAEMAFAGGVGASVDLRNVPVAQGVARNDVIAFSESNSRFIVEVSKAHQTEFEKLFADLPCALIGNTVQSPKFEVRGMKGSLVISEHIAELKESWQGTLRW